MTQLKDLAKPFAKHLIHTNPSGGGEYVKHGAAKEKLLAVVGPYNFALVEVVRGFVAAKAPNPNGSSRRAKEGTPELHDAVVGAVCRLTVTIDGTTVSVEDVGDCEEPSNWPHDGARLKDAMSDAIKRCAAHVGVGLHLWSQDAFFLHQFLTNREAPADPVTRPAEASLAGVAGARAALDGTEPFEATP